MPHQPSSPRRRLAFLLIIPTPEKLRPTRWARFLTLSRATSKRRPTWATPARYRRPTILRRSSWDETTNFIPPQCSQSGNSRSGMKGGNFSPLWRLREQRMVVQHQEVCDRTGVVPPELSRGLTFALRGLVGFHLVPRACAVGGMLPP